MHALGEATELPDASFDLITLQFLIHEVPPALFPAITKSGSWRAVVVCKALPLQM